MCHVFWLSSLPFFFFLQVFFIVEKPAVLRVHTRTFVPRSSDYFGEFFRMDYCCNCPNFFCSFSIYFVHPNFKNQSTRTLTFSESGFCLA